MLLTVLLQFPLWKGTDSPYRNLVLCIVFHATYLYTYDSWMQLITEVLLRMSVNRITGNEASWGSIIKAMLLTKSLLFSLWKSIDSPYLILVLCIVFHATYLSTYDSWMQLITEVLLRMSTNRIAAPTTVTNYPSFFLLLRFVLVNWSLDDDITKFHISGHKSNQVSSSQVGQGDQSLSFTKWKDRIQQVQRWHSTLQCRKSLI